MVQVDYHTNVHSFLHRDVDFLSIWDLTKIAIFIHPLLLENLMALTAFGDGLGGGGGGYAASLKPCGTAALIAPPNSSTGVKDGEDIALRNVSLFVG